MPSALPEDNVRLFFPDDATRRDVVIRYGTQDMSWNAGHFGESTGNEPDRMRRRRASFAIERWSDPHRALAGDDGARPSPTSLGWLANRWRLTVENVGFPGGPATAKPPRLIFTFERPADLTLDIPLGAWTVKLDAEHWPQPGRSTSFGPVPLGLFLGGWAKLETALAAKPAQFLLEGWFGKRIETTDSVTLSVGQDLRWRVISPKHRLFILDLARPETSSPFGFAELEVLRTFPEGSVIQPSQSGQQVRPSPETSELAQNAASKVGSPADANRLEQERLFAEFTPARQKPSDRMTPGLYGILSRPSELETAGKSRFEFAVTEGPGAVRAMIALSDIGRMQAALRHWGDPALTVAGVRLETRPVDENQTSREDPPDTRRAILSIEPARQNGRAPGDPAFEIAQFQIVRQLVPDPRPSLADKMVEVTIAHLTPRAKEHLVQTPFGPMEVRAAPKVPPATGKFARTPPIELRAFDGPGPQGRRLLDRFDGVFSLLSVGVRLPPTTRMAASSPPRADEPFARLEFDHAECRFALPGVAPDTSVVSADALVPLGPKAGIGEGALLDLGRARLTVLRPSDLLSLKYRFSGLLLHLPLPGPGAAARVLPNRGGPVCRGGSPAETHPTRDLRPIMVVEFPPQHVAERAYFRQVPTVSFPVLYPSPAQEGWLAELRKLARAPGADPVGEARRRRVALREQISQSGRIFPFDPKQPKPDPKDVVSEFERRAGVPQDKRRALPVEQRTYVGPDFLDAAGRRLMREVLRDTAETNTFEPISKFELPQPALMEVLAPFGLIPALDGKTAYFSPTGSSDNQRDAAIAVELSKDRLNADYAEFRQGFGIVSVPGWKEVGYLGWRWFEEVKAELPRETRVFVDEYEARRQEPLEPVTEARLSGPSRLAFRINCDDFQAERQGGGFAFSLEGLTDWGSMDLSVVRRAERLVAPPARGPWAPRWGRVYDLDDTAMLRHVGLSGGDHIAAESARSAHGAPASGLPAYRLPGTLATPAQRLAEVAGSARSRPDPFQTAIELPFRLTLSPAQDATWRVPNPSVREKAFPGAAPIPFRELWSASLAGNGAQAGVRAVWSPDFRPDALTSIRAPGAPPHGPWAPWSLPGMFGLRRMPKDAASAGLRTFRTTIDAYDRHEIVALSSVHGLPVLGRRDTDGSLKGGSQFEPPAGFALDGLKWDSPPPGEDGIVSKPRDYSAIYRPQPLLINELALTALGGNLDHDTAFTPPASARLALDGGGAVNLFDALSIERWRNRTVLGRDIAVEIVYKGFLFPIGHKAALVKLTERRFEASPDGRSPVAVLIQREFLRVGDPEKHFPAFLHPNEARRWPARRVEMLTRRTPDLVQHETADGGKIHLGAGTGVAFWPRTSPRSGAEVQFEMRIDEEGAAGALPLIFVDNTAAHDETTIKELVEYYQNQPEAMRRLPRNGQGVRMAPPRKTGDTTYVTDWWEILAEGRTSTPISVAGATTSVTLDNSNYAMDPFMEGLDQPGFYPLVYKARCRLSQVEKMTGRQTVWAEVGYDGYYVARGFLPDSAPGQLNPAGETFLRIAGASVPMQMADGERSGGIGQPNTHVVGLSRETGPVGANAPGIAPASPDPKTVESISVHSQALTAKSLFPENAKLLGLVKLSEIVRLTLTEQPKLKEITEYGASEAAGAGSAARGFITDSVLRPVQAGVALLDEQWKVLAAANPFVKEASLDKAYPQIGAALKLLETTMAQSLAPSLDDAAFFVSLADIYEAGRGLVTVIDEVLRDPVASLSAAQSMQLHELIEQVQLVAKALSDPRAALTGALQAARDQALALLLKDAPWQRLFFALPSLPPGDTDAAAFDAACAAALERALGKAVANGTLDDLGKDVVEELSKGAAGTVRAKLDEAAGEIRQMAGDQADRLLAHIASPRLMLARTAAQSILKELRIVTQMLAQPSVANLTKLPGSLAEILAQAAVLRGQPVAIPGLRAVCDKLGRLQATVANLAGLLVPLDDPATASDLAKLGTALMAHPVLPGPAAGLPASTDTIKLDEAALSARNLVAAIDHVMATFEPLNTDLTALKVSREKIADAGSRLAFALARAQREVAAAIQWPQRTSIGCEVDGPLLSMAVTLTAQRDAALDAVRDMLAAAKELPKELQDLAALPAQTLIAAAAPALLNAVASARATMLGGVRLYRAITLLAARAPPARTLEGTTSDRQVYLADVKAGVDAVAAALPDGAAKMSALAASTALQQAAMGLATLEGDLSRRAIELRAIALTNLNTALMDLAATADRVDTFAKDIEKQLRQEIEQKVLQLVLRLGPSAVAPVQDGIAGVATTVLTELQKAYGAVAKGRDKLQAAVKGSADGKSLLDSFLRILRSKLGDQLFTVPCPAGAPPACVDRLDYEKKLTDDALAAAVAKDVPGMLDAARSLVEIWKDPGPAVVAIVRQIGTVNIEFVRNILLSAIDLKQLQRVVESRIRSLIPTRVVLPYDLDNELNSFPHGDDPIFIPDPGTRLQLHSRTVVDLRSSGGPQLSVSGELGPFKVALLGKRFDVVTLLFDGLSFKSGTGISADFRVRFRDVKIGEKAKFLEQLQSYLSPKGGGFYLKFMRGGSPGIEAGYGINLGVIGIGTLSFSNVILNAAVRLPFDNNAEARFLISIGRADAPFLISSTIFGGGGYLGLIASSQGFVGFEASFDYGGVAAFGFGPLQGVGRLTMGVYLRKEGDLTSLGATFFAGGAAHIACFGFSTALMVRMVQDNGGPMCGTASYTFSFSLGIKDIDFQVQVTKNEGSGMGSSKSAAIGPAGPPGTMLAQAAGAVSDAAPAVPVRIKPGKDERPKIKGVSQDWDWWEYRRYFDLNIHPAERWSPL